MDLSPTKRALLEKWLTGRAIPDEPRIPKRSIQSAVQLSFPQQRQLFLELLERGTAVNNLSVLLELEGPTDLFVLEESANRIMERHEVLRTRFLFGIGMPVPEILNDLKISFSIVDLSNINEEDRSSKVVRLAEQEVQQPFDLSRAPLIRLKLYKVNPERNFLLVVIHHSIADGWSLGVFLKEWMAYYRSFVSGEPVKLTELTIQYPDFAEWQTSDTRAAAFLPSMEYWVKQLGGELPVLELPTDRPRGARQTFVGGTYRFRVKGSLAVACEELSRKEDVTVYMTMLTVFNLLLHKYSGQDDIIVGTPIANRNMPELEALIGVFINTLAIRTDISGDPSFLDLLKRVRAVTLDAIAHQDLPFEKLVEELRPKRDLSRTPVFQAVFNLQNSPMPDFSIPGIRITRHDLDRGVSEFDISIVMSKQDGQYEVSLEYNKDLFAPETICKISHSFLMLLEGCISNPGTRVSALPWMPAEEIDRLVHKLNQTQVEHQKEKCFYQLFEEKVKVDPGAIAVIHEESRLSYAELNCNANKLADRLRKEGVVPGTRVGVLIERSLEIVEALLAIQKAGGIYVPIQSTLPEERISYILKDAGIHVLLTNIDQLPVRVSDVKVVYVRKCEEPGGELTTSDQPRQVTAADLVYIIYTSGSTGQPKGVMVEHSALVNFLFSMQREPGITKDDILLSVTSISFDIAALELFLPLSVGATIVMASNEMMANPVLMANDIQRYGVTMMQATPATWQILVEAGWKGDPGLKALCGGEALTKKLANQILDRVGSLWNMYGPTETTIWSSVSKVSKEDAVISIGSPIDNTRFYILDPYLKPVPVGVFGELHIGGKGLARGYLDQPELTAKKFIPDPFVHQPGERMYKTGDRARYLPDGAIEVVGRFDHQVKIHGYRIELGEVEAVLRQHPAVMDSVVILAGEANCSKQLVAFYVPAQEKQVDSAALQEFMRKKLPVYMIPAAYVCLESMPLTPNGKIDRNALPVPVSGISHDQYIGPRNEEEKILVDIWESVLGIRPISVLDNFFDLGGASIQSLQIVGHANMAGLRLNAEMVFEYQTIAGLAEQLRLETKDGK